MQNQKLISATEFKKHFLQLVDEVTNKKTSFTITKRKIPVALVTPLNNEEKKVKSYFGFMRGTTKIRDDIVNCSFESDWEINNE
jgi:antitoxin (DNA-binding transcriptional repressor) of toxin-antitoxin stability system